MGNIDYQRLVLPYRPHDPNDTQEYPFVVVGAGPVGLTMALDLAHHGHRVVLIDDDDCLSIGSRAICFSKRALDIWDRLGVGEVMVAKGVSWSTGRLFFRDEEVWQFNLLPEDGHRRPAFINLQQYYCEGFLYEAVGQQADVSLRWKHKAVAVDQTTDGVSVRVQTPDGDYTLRCQWLIACDGARSTIRRMLGQETTGQTFRDRFLIADVRIELDYPPERWYWFDPPFHRGQSALLHRQPDNVWRIDFQLGWDADPHKEAEPERVRKRIQAMLGQGVEFDLEWVSVYTFACERMARFRHGRVLFAGDAAYRVSPFGARGANSGLQDSDNLAWKLDLVARGYAPESLLETYCEERSVAADENLRHSSRSTDFITPKSEISLLFRNITLTLAKTHDFARAMINSGRLSTSTWYTDSSLNTPDTDVFHGGLAVGADAPDGPIHYPQSQTPDWWLSVLGGRFVFAVFCPAAVPSAAVLSDLKKIQDDELCLEVILIVSPETIGNAPADWHTVIDTQGLLAQRYDAGQLACYLFRPDQHIAARWRNIDMDAIRQALRRATAKD